MEAVRRDMQHEPPQEFHGIKRQSAQAVAALGVFIADGQEEVRPTRGPLGSVERQAPCGEDAMEMRVMVELLAPGVEHGEAADLCPEMPRVRGDVLERLGDRAKE